MAQPTTTGATGTAAKGTTASTGADLGPPEHGGAFPPFRSETFAAQLIWLALAFGLLYVLMSRVALPRIAGILHNRATRLSADLDEAHRMRAEAEAAGTAYERSLTEARDRAKAIAQKTRDELSAEADARRKVLEGDLASRLAASETAIRESTRRAMTNVREIASETATAIVERLTGQAPDRAALDGALDRALAKH